MKPLDEAELPLLGSPPPAKNPTCFIKLSKVDAGSGSSCHWTRAEKYAWFFTLLFGTTALYACRTTMPLVAPACAEQLDWSKTEVGTVLSSFFWGYCLTQILGGYLSDTYGAERVLLAGGIVWALLTFWFEKIIMYNSMSLLVLTRILVGASQGVHFPAMASISSKKLNTRDRGIFFSASSSGGALGTLVTGSIGSIVNDKLGWPYVFYTIGFMAVVWVLLLKHFTMDKFRVKNTVIGMSSSTSLSAFSSSPSSKSGDQVPWLTYLRSKALWACVFCHFCQNNCFFILLSWLPTYFHDNYPGAQSWVFNVVPYVLMVPGIVAGAYLSNRMSAKGHPVGNIRKTMEAIAMGSESVCLMLIGVVGTSYALVMMLISLGLFCASFHTVSVVVNPQDLAPRHSGSVFGIMNAAGALPGFIGVYLAGYILELTSSWTAVFNVTAVINLCGLAVFIAFGSGEPIIP